MLKTILIGVLAAGTIGTGYYGYNEHKEKNAVLMQAENNYQRAFHDLTHKVNLLHDEIGSTLAMNSRQSLSPSLIEVWRITSEAQSDVGQLPLTLMPFNKTEKFLANIGAFSYQTAARDLDKEPLSKEESKTLQKLYEKSEEIQQELENTQHLVIKNNLKWTDVETALADGKQPEDNSIVDGFATVEKNVEGYQDNEFGPTFTNISQLKEVKKEKKTGKQISESEAKKIAKKFLRLKGNEEIVVATTTNKSIYSLSITDKKNKIETYIDIDAYTKKPIWAIENRDVKEQKISLNEATEKGLLFLKEQAFSNIELFDSTQYDNMAFLDFAVVEKGVHIYPRSIKMKIALDDGTILGFSAKDYLAFDKKWTWGKPKISIEEARKKVNPNVEIMEEHKAIIVGKQNKEVPCYEFVAISKSDTYQIFINANTNQEEKVEKLQTAEQTYGDF